MDILPEQLRAARALLDLNQADLAARANRPSSVVTALERRDRADPVDPADLQAVRQTLEELGVEFIPRGVRRSLQDGVRRRVALTPDQQRLYDDLRAISLESAAQLKGIELLTDDDLYDENGLPA